MKNYIEEPNYHVGDRVLVDAYRIRSGEFRFLRTEEAIIEEVWAQRTHCGDKSWTKPFYEVRNLDRVVEYAFQKGLHLRLIRGLIS